jgi:hypothetical protein
MHEYAPLANVSPIVKALRVLFDEKAVQQPDRVGVIGNNSRIHNRGVAPGLALNIVHQRPDLLQCGIAGKPLEDAGQPPLFVMHLGRGPSGVKIKGFNGNKVSARVCC